MGQNDGLIDLDTPTRGGGYFVETVFDPGRTRSKVTAPGHVVVLKRFQNKKIGNVGTKVNCNDRAQRTTAVVGSYTDIMGLSKGRDLLSLHEAPAVDDIGLDDMRSLSGQ